MPDRRVQWRWAFVAVAALASAAAALQARSLFAFYQGHERLPLWDMASHGWGGLEPLRALTGGHLWRFLSLLNHQDTWPPGFSLLLMPFLAAGGGSFSAATLASTVFFALVPALLLWAAYEVDAGPAGLWGGLLAGALFASAPLYRVFAILVMRETAGLCLALAAFALFSRARRLGTVGAWRLAGLAMLALFFVKYNYGLIWGICAAADELLRRPAARRREILLAAGRALVPGLDRRRGRIALALFLDGLLSALLLGVNPGYWVYAGLLAATITLLLALRRRSRNGGASRRESLKARWQALSPAARGLLATVVLPLWVWALVPDPIHPKALFAFLRNRSSGMSRLDVDYWLYYPRIFLRDYAVSPLTGGIVLALAALGALAAIWALWRTWRPETAAESGSAAGSGFRLLALTAVVGFGLATLHPYKEPRFLATAAPFLLLLATLAFARAVHGARGGGLRIFAGGLVCAVVLAATIWIACNPAPGRTDHAARLASDYDLFSADPAYGNALEALRRGLPATGRVAIVGCTNELSENLVRWYLAQAGTPPDVEIVRAPQRFASDLAVAKMQAKLRSWLGRERPERILALRPTAGSTILASEDYRRFNAWQLRALDALQEPGLPPGGWRVTARRRLPKLGLAVLVLEPGA